jgi:hypothetical protein
MDYDFREIIGKLIDIYKDELTIISKKRGQHIQHLRTIFQKCRENGISLDPKKLIFNVDIGKLLGHIISKDGISIKPSKIEAIKKVPIHKDKKALQSFFVQINFIRRFILKVYEIFRNGEATQSLVKKGCSFKMGQ